MISRNSNDKHIKTIAVPVYFHGSLQRTSNHIKGAASTREIAFLKKAHDFIEGIGAMEVKNGRPRVLRKLDCTSSPVRISLDYHQKKWGR